MNTRQFYDYREDSTETDVADDSQSTAWNSLQKFLMLRIQMQWFGNSARQVILLGSEVLKLNVNVSVRASGAFLWRADKYSLTYISGAYRIRTWISSGLLFLVSYFTYLCPRRVPRRDPHWWHYCQDRWDVGGYWVSALKDMIVLFSLS